MCIYNTYNDFLKQVEKEYPVGRKEVDRSFKHNLQSIDREIVF